MQFNRRLVSLAVAAAAILSASVAAAAPAAEGAKPAISYKQLTTLIKNARGGEDGRAKAVVGKTVRVKVVKGNENYLVVNPDDQLAFVCSKTEAGFKAPGDLYGTIVKYGSNVEDEIILTIDNCKP